MRKNHMLGLSLVASTLSLAASLANASIVNYDTPGDLTTNFNLNSATPTHKYTQVAAGGIGNSGAVNLLGAVDQPHTTAVYNQDSYRFTMPGDTVTLSQYVLRKNGALTQTPFMQLGILADSSDRMYENASPNAYSYASVQMVPISAGITTNVRVDVITKVDNGSRVTTPVFPSQTLSTGNWYLFSATFTYQSPTSVLVSGSLEDWGATGLAFASTTYSFGPTSIALSGTNQVNGDGSVWAGYRGFDEGGSDLYDNFSVVPEPATLALLGLAAVSILRRRR